MPIAFECIFPAVGQKFILLWVGSEHCPGYCAENEEGTEQEQTPMSLTEAVKIGPKILKIWQLSIQNQPEDWDESIFKIVLWEPLFNMVWIITEEH